MRLPPDCGSEYYIAYLLKVHRIARADADKKTSFF
jgi:hypothetical protein